MVGQVDRMSGGDELAALAVEVAAEPGPAESGLAARSPENAAPAMSPEARAAYITLFATGTRVGGDIACDMFKVTRLEDGEVGALAEAMMGVAALYDLATLDARSAAWLSLGMTAMGVVMKRRRIPDAASSGAVAPGA